MEISNCYTFYGPHSTSSKNNRAKAYRCLLWHVEFSYFYLGKNSNNERNHFKVNYKIQCHWYICIVILPPLLSTSKIETPDLVSSSYSPSSLANNLIITIWYSSIQFTFYMNGTWNFAHQLLSFSVTFLKSIHSEPVSVFHSFSWLVSSVVCMQFVSVVITIGHPLSDWTELNGHLWTVPIFWLSLIVLWSYYQMCWSFNFLFLIYSLYLSDHKSTGYYWRKCGN